LITLQNKLNHFLKDININTYSRVLIITAEYFLILNGFLETIKNFFQQN